MHDWFTKNRKASLDGNEHTFSDFLTLLKKGLFSTWHSPEGFPLEDYTLITPHPISLKPPGKTRSPEVLTDLSSYTAADYITGASSRRGHTYFFLSSESPCVARFARVGKVKARLTTLPFTDISATLGRETLNLWHQTLEISSLISFHASFFGAWIYRNALKCMKSLLAEAQTSCNKNSSWHLRWKVATQS